MRTRNRTSQTTIPAGNAKTFNPAGVLLVDSALSSIVYDDLSEIIVDQLSYKQKSGNCAHSKARIWLCDVPHRTPMYETGGGPLYTEYTNSGFIRAIVPSWQTQLEPVITPSSFDWGRASFDALESMKPSLTEMLLPNFLSELKESSLNLGRKAKKKLADIERKRIQSLRQQIQRQKPGFKPRRKDLVPSAPIWDRTFGALRKMATTLSWVNLAWQFAIRPTLEDAKSIGEIIDQTKKQLSELIRQGDKMQRRHYKRPCDILTLPSRSLLGVGQQRAAFWTRTWRRFEWMQRPVYHASCLFSYDTERIRGTLGQIDAMIHSFGVSRMGSVLWEAIPYSFVVDWFVSVGDLIASIEDQLLDPLPIVIHDFSHSLKYEYKTTLEVECSINSLASYYATLDVANKFTTVYERRRDVPSLWDSLSARTPSSNQVGLGLSLIILKMDGVHKGKFRRN